MINSETTKPVYSHFSENAKHSIVGVTMQIFKTQPAVLSVLGIIRGILVEQILPVLLFTTAVVYVPLLKNIFREFRKIAQDNLH